MLRLLIFLSIFASFETLACRVPYEAHSGLIEFEYLDEKGTYFVKTPAFIGKGEVISVGLSYSKQGATKYSRHEFSTSLKGMVIEESWIGIFSARSKEGFDAWISVSWSTSICSTRSSKKVKLFPSDA